MIFHAVDITTLPLGTWFVNEFGEHLSHTWGDSAWTLVEKKM